MFTATSLAVGPVIVYYLIARTGDANALRTAMKFDQALERTAGGFYGLGIVFGLVAAVSGSLDLTAPWLVAAYALLVLLIANNLFLSRRMEGLKEATSSADRSALDKLTRAPALTSSIAILGILTLALVYVMVAKPAFF